MSEAFSDKAVDWRSLIRVAAVAVPTACTVGGIGYTVLSSWFTHSERVSQAHREATDARREIGSFRAEMDARTAKRDAEAQRLDAASAMRHQQQQAELDRLRLQAEGFQSSISVLSTQLGTVLDLLKELKMDVRTLSGQARVEVQPAPVITLPSVAPPVSRLNGLAPAPFGQLPPRPSGR